jgi:hypothetical protein
MDEFHNKGRPLLKLRKFRVVVLNKTVIFMAQLNVPTSASIDSGMSVLRAAENSVVPTCDIQPHLINKHSILMHMPTVSYSLSFIRYFLYVSTDGASFLFKKILFHFFRRRHSLEKKSPAVQARLLQAVHKNSLYPILCRSTVIRHRISAISGTSPFVSRPRFFVAFLRTCRNLINHSF